MQVPSAYRRAASAVFVTLALAAVAVSCADYTGPLAPDGGPDPAAAWKNAVDSTGVLDWDGEIGIATGTPPECDPEVEIIECDPPDGGGGYVDDNVACSNCTPLEPSRLQTLQDATPEICAPHRTAVAGALNNGEWGKFTYSSSAYRGNHEKSTRMHTTIA